MVKKLTWPQVSAYRLAQHGLAPRLKSGEPVEAARRTLGVQAQVMSAAELALGARVKGLAPQGVQAALWQERTLLKTWAMRATLHLLAAADLPLYVAARRAQDDRQWVKYFAYYGIPQVQYEALLTAAPQVLGSEPLTREQLAAALAEQAGVSAFLDLVLSKSWGTPLKPLAWRGDLCFGPSQGQQVTFVRPEKWLSDKVLGAWQSLEPFEALQEIARRYLRAYGPATPEIFAQWWGGWSGIRLARKVFQALEEELEAVEVEGWRGLALQAALEPIQGMAMPGSVSLLPLFDAYVLGLGRGADLEPILPRGYQIQVYRPQGWISAVVLVDGVMMGVWEYQTRGARTTLKVRMFSALSARIQEGVEAEAERLGEFWKTEVVVEWVSLP